MACFLLGAAVWGYTTQTMQTFFMDESVYQLPADEFMSVIERTGRAAWLRVLVAIPAMALGAIVMLVIQVKYHLFLRIEKPRAVLNKTDNDSAHR
jgi:hypothetical protein